MLFATCLFDVVLRRSISICASRYCYPTTFNLSQQPRMNRRKRSLFYVPASDSRKLEKSKTINADFVCLDIEDGVGVASKDEARNNIANFMNSLQSRDLDRFGVRVNPVSLPDLLNKDIRSVLSAKHLPVTLLLPKVDSVDDLKIFRGILRAALRDAKRIDEKTACPFRLVIYTESPKGLMNLRDICMYFENVDKVHHDFGFELDSVVFGSDDYCAQMGIQRTETGEELMYARQKVACVARAFNLLPIDMVSINFRDLGTLERVAKEGASLGFAGKQIIHPAQIETVQRSFTPTEEQVSWAKGLVAEFQAGQSRGVGAIEYQGSMIDMPLYRQALNVLQTAGEHIVQRCA